MLYEAVNPMTPAPVATLTTDRASYGRDDTLQLNLVLEYPHHPRSFDGYLILEPPHGPALFFDGHSMPRPAGVTSPAWGRNLPLPARATARFAIPLAALSPGAYRWHVVLTEPGAYRAVAQATAAFEIGR